MRAVFGLLVLCLVCWVAACGDDTGSAGGAPGTGGMAGSAGAGGMDGCSSNSECSPEELCESLVSCGERGQCEARPETCTLEIDPVCGCDGETYDNACTARAAGVRVSGAGMCNCDANRDCDEAEYCNADTCDGPGTCTPRPTIESCESMPTEPAADCSDVGFDNPCFVAAAGRRLSTARSDP